MFWFGIAATALWLVLIVGMAATRSSEWWPLFGAGDNRLALNAVGDTLAGVFAPLAFLWLFVAAWLQRRELQLQREELSQTRDVLASQMKELERSADESRH